MIFLDTNIFLRYLVRSPEPRIAANSTIAHDLFRSISRNEQTVTTSEVVIHEVCYVLCSPKQYGIPAKDVAEALISVLQMPGFRFERGEADTFIEALELLALRPKLEFADAVIAVRAHRLGIPLATFDRTLARLPIVTPWNPESDKQP